MKAKTFTKLVGTAVVAVVLAGCLTDDDDPNNGINNGGDNGGSNSGGSLVNTGWFDNTPAALTYTITTAAQLAGLAQLVNEGSSFVGRTIILGNDIDLAVYGVLSPTFNNGRGWVPIGTWTSATNNKPFGGTLDGNGKTITGLYAANSNQNNFGLFGFVDGGTVKNLGVVGASVSGRENTGGLVGRGHGVKVEDSYLTGTVNGNNFTGGLVGFLNGGTVERSYSAATVGGASHTGGLVGLIEGGGAVRNTYTTGNTNGGTNVGGVVGTISAHPRIGADAGGGGSVSLSYATGTVSGGERVGGVAGLLFHVGSNATSCIALNSNVQGNWRVVGSTGYVTSLAGTAYTWHATSGPVPSDNEGFAGTRRNGITVVWDEETDEEIALNGISYTAAAIAADPTFGDRFNSFNGWTTAPGKLPGFGAPVDLPAHLAP